METSFRFMLPSTLQHIAIIMDGNGRWALQKGYLRTIGHKAGAKAFSAILEECVAIQLPVLTVYAFSKENWKRSPKEINTLFALLLYFIKKDIDAILQHNIQLRFLGDIEDLPLSIQNAITYAVEKTKSATGLLCNIAFNYSAQEEILRACKLLNSSSIESSSITIEDFKKHLYTSDIPDPDLIIRTGGEYRMSNFLLFQSAYSELYFSSLLWPDFTKEALHEAIIEFSKRKRNFGA